MLYKNASTKTACNTFFDWKHRKQRKPRCACKLLTETCSCPTCQAAMALRINSAKPAPTRQNTPARKRQNRHSQIACLFTNYNKTPLTKLQTASFAQKNCRQKCCLLQNRCKATKYHTFENKKNGICVPFFCIFLRSFCTLGLSNSYLYAKHRRNLQTQPCVPTYKFFVTVCQNSQQFWRFYHLGRMKRFCSSVRSNPNVPPGFMRLSGSKWCLRVLKISIWRVPICPSNHGAKNFPMPWWWEIAAPLFWIWSRIPLQ